MGTSMNEHEQWRFELCERLGMSCAGHTWTVDEVFEFINWLNNLPENKWNAPAGVNRGDLKAAISGTDTMLTLSGKKFRCNCGANVFSKTLTDGYYRCNGCDGGYETLPHKLA